MVELSTCLRQLLAESGQTISHLAQHVNMDRATLSKVLNGQRTPTPPQMERLLHALRASPQQRLRAMELFENARIPPATLACRRQIQQLLQSIFSVQDTLNQPLVLPSITWHMPQDSALVRHVPTQPDALVALRFLMDRFLSNPSAGPLMLSPGLGAPWMGLISAALAKATDARRQVWHLSQFIKRPQRDDEIAWNLRNLTQALPFVYLGHADYTARFFYSTALERQPAALLSTYVLFPDTVFGIPSDGRGALILHEPTYVERCRQNFAQTFRESSAFVGLGAQEYDEMEQLDYRGHFSRLGCESFSLRYEPPMVLTLDEALVRRFLAPDLPNRDQRLPDMLARLHDVQNLHAHCFFTEAGVRDFVISGRIAETDDHLYAPLSPALRRLLLERLADLCESGPSDIRLLNPQPFQPPRNMYVDVYRDHGLLFVQKVSRPDDTVRYRSCYFSEDSITGAFCDFFQYLRTSSLLYTRQETASVLRQYAADLPDTPAAER